MNKYFNRHIKVRQNVFLCLPLLILLAAPAAMAKPFVLECFTVHQNLSREPFSVKVDEQTKIVTHSGSHDTFIVKGVFAPDQIIYQHQQSEGFGLQTQQKYIVNRQTLKVTHFTTSRGENSPGGTTQIFTGACTPAFIADGNKTDSD